MSEFATTGKAGTRETSGSLPEKVGVNTGGRMVSSLFFLTSFFQLISLAGDFYEGNFQHNKRNGQGKFVWKSGNWYEGWLHEISFLHFKLIQFFYAGEWKDNERDGNGKYVWSNGNSYEGTFVANKRNGKGKFVWSNGNIYEGFYLFSSFYIQFQISFFLGEFVDNKRHGKGKMIWSNGKAFYLFFGFFKPFFCR